MKKFTKILLMLTCVFALTACGQEVKTLSDQYANVFADGYTLEDFIVIPTQAAYQLVSSVDDEVYSEYTNYNDDQKDSLGKNFADVVGVTTEGQVFIDAVTSYRGSVEDIGNPQADFENATVKVSKDEVIVTVPISGTVHQGSFEAIYDKNLHLTSMTTNIMYSFAEAMGKAGQNTLIGMGTVFVMLIVIMFIIMILGACCSEKKEKKDETASDSVDKAIEGIVAREEAADDTELVAVIAAAIAAYEGSSTDDFIVRSIKRIK